MLTTLLSATPSHASSVYDVVPTSDTIAIDGTVDEKAWQQAYVIDGSFHYPWENIRAPRTTFRALRDDDVFYFNFVVEDQAVVVLEKPIGERETVDAEDRVELFFAPSAIDEPVNYELPTYYAIEIDPVGRIHDYSMVYYRNIDSSWSMEGLETKTSLTDQGYNVEAKIPLATLQQLGLLSEDGQLRIGIYRAEFTPDGDSLNMQWISWVDPETEVPDFHVESSIGMFRFPE